MTKRPQNQQNKQRQALACLTFLLFIVVTMSYGAIYAFRDLPLQLGFDIDRPLQGFETIVAIAFSLFIMVFLLYAGAILWLLFARFVFTKEEAESVVFYGPTTPLERWLVNTIFPED